MKFIFLGCLIFSFSSAFAQSGDSSPRLNEVFQLSDHNGYWVNRHPPEVFASGVQERILDQLLFDHSRSIEIDVHKDPFHDGQWNVFHTDAPANAFCSPFTECLKQLRQFQYAVPKHEVVTIMIELKEIVEYNFDNHHTPADFDALLESYLGDLLYRPRDFLSRCPANGADGKPISMRECAKLVGWPTVESLRGKFIFAILGNWNWEKILGHGSAGWATYATWREGTSGRSAFPMISDWTTTEPMSASLRAAAENQSIFLQGEDYSDPTYLKHLQDLMVEGVLIRMDNAFSLSDQQDRVSKGFQYLQTDHPWIQYQERGPAEPFKGFDGSSIQEPGYRLLMTQVSKGATATALLVDQNSSSEWEGFFSSTRSTTNPLYPNLHAVRGKGCFQASSNTDSYRVCRVTVEARPSKILSPYPEDAAITVEITRGLNTAHPVTTTQTFYTDAHQAGQVGDGLKLSINNLANGSACVTASSSSEMDAKTQWSVPLWNVIGKACFSHPLASQGISASEGDVLFVGVKHDQTSVRASDFTLQTANSGYSFTDLSVE